MAHLAVWGVVKKNNLCGGFLDLKPTTDRVHLTLFIPRLYMYRVK